MINWLLNWRIKLTRQVKKVRNIFCPHRHVIKWSWLNLYLNRLLHSGSLSLCLSIVQANNLEVKTKIYWKRLTHWPPTWSKLVGWENFLHDRAAAAPKLLTESMKTFILPCVWLLLFFFFSSYWFLIILRFYTLGELLLVLSKYQ